MAYELNDSENYSIGLTEISLHTSSSDIGSPIFLEQHDFQSLYKETFIYSTITSPANNNNPKKVWTVIADTTNYSVFGFHFNGYVSLSNSGTYANVVRWSLGYNTYENAWYNDGLDSTSVSSYAITNPGSGDNYAELVSSAGDPDKFDFYMDIRSFSFATYTFRISGNLQIFANYIAPSI